MALVALCSLEEPGGGIAAPAARITRLHRRLADAQRQQARTTTEVLEAVRAKAGEASGPGAPITAVLDAIGRNEERERIRDEVVRLSRESIALLDIATRTGLTYDQVRSIRHLRRVNPRRPRRAGGQQHGEA